MIATVFKRSDCAAVIVSHFMIEVRGQAQEENVHLARIVNANALSSRCRNNDGGLLPSWINCGIR